MWILRKRWWILASTTPVVIAIAVIATVATATDDDAIVEVQRFQATATYQSVPLDVSQLNSLESLSLARALATMFQMTIQRMNTADRSDARISAVDIVEGTPFINVTAVGTDQQGVVAAANGVTQLLAVDTGSATLDLGYVEGRLQPYLPAEIATALNRPPAASTGIATRVLMNAIGGGLIGLIIGAIAAIGLHSVRRSAIPLQRTLSSPQSPPPIPFDERDSTAA